MNLKLKSDEHYAQFLGLIGKYAKQCQLNGLGSYEDCFQECSMVYLKACDSFDESRAKFSTYLSTLLQNAFYKMLKDRRKEIQTVSLDVSLYDDDVTFIDYVENTYVEVEGEIIKQMYEGKTIRQVAKEMGLSKSEAHRRLQKEREYYYGKL